MFFFWPFHFIFYILIFIFTFRILSRLVRQLFFGPGQAKPRSFPGRETTASSASPNYKIKPGSPEGRERQIFNAAKKLRGRLTLSDVVMETDMSLAEAEKALHRLVDEVHVRMIVKNNGLIIYEFPEIMARFQEGKDFYKDI